MSKSQTPHMTVTFTYFKLSFLSYLPIKISFTHFMRMCHLPTKNAVEEKILLNLEKLGLLLTYQCSKHFATMIPLILNIPSMYIHSPVLMKLLVLTPKPLSLVRNFSKPGAHSCFCIFWFPQFSPTGHVEGEHSA